MGQKGKSDYWTKLQDPRWQRMRLEVFERDGFSCVKCMDSESTLHVHHCYYEWGADPWDYPESSLVTLCETCHEEESAMQAGLRQRFFAGLCEQGILSEPISDFGEALKHRFRQMGPGSSQLLVILADVLSNDETYQGLLGLYASLFKTPDGPEAK